MLEQDNRAGWLIKFSAAVVGIAVAAYVWRCSKRRLGNLQEVDGADDSELTCFCGLPAKLRVSRTSKNLYRLFYNCPKNEYFHQCAFFRWSDEISADSERHLKEKNFLRDECIHLQQKVDLIISQRQQERNDWDREEEELRSQLSAVQSELDDINKRMQEVNESEEMPPVDESYRVDDKHDGAVVLESV